MEEKTGRKDGKSGQGQRVGEAGDKLDYTS